MRNHGRPTFDQILFDQLTSYRKVNFRRNYCSVTVYDIYVVPLIIKLTRRLYLDRCVTEFLCLTRIKVLPLWLTFRNRIPHITTGCFNVLQQVLDFSTLKVQNYNWLGKDLEAGSRSEHSWQCLSGFSQKVPLPAENLKFETNGSFQNQFNL